MNKRETKSVAAEGSPEDWLEVVRRSVENLRFGSVQIIVHEGRVTQVESIKKTRFLAGQDNPPKG